MLRKIRIFTATISFALVTLLFLDFTGTLHAWFGWMAKIQFLPAVLALNFGVVAGLILLTLLLGRVYCSVICPLGIMQDIFSSAAGRRTKNRFKYTKPHTLLRWGVLVVFVALLCLGFGSFALLIAPYSAFGRIAQNLLAPIWQAGNNLLALIAERIDSYAFYSTDIWIRSVGAFIVAVATLLILAIIAWRKGRLYCNSICPVGTVLGVLSKYSLFKPVINTEKCNGCNRCARNCKSSCIDTKAHTIDYSRCVVCMDCIENCNQGAISYSLRKGKRVATPTPKPEKASESRRDFLVATGLLAASAVKAQEMKLDGGYATIIDKQAPPRENKITPAGSLSARNMTTHCTGCQLCVAACPSQILRPSTQLTTFMQPFISYEKGYCRPECNKCASVCPTGAIKPISIEEKSSTQIGHAVWVRKNCVVITDDVDCGNCERHCPSGAITMVAIDAQNPQSKKIPAINTERCIGCGACENLCPSRPFSAIYVEGHRVHKTI